MLFNSFVFLFIFLPVVLAGYYAAARLGRSPAAVWLVFSSFVFYGWWDVRFLTLLFASIIYNYGTSRLIQRLKSRPALQSAALIIGISGDLGLLFYYKYLFPLLNFFYLHGIIHSSFANVVLPLGISFFTFTQIGYLVDVRQGVTRDQSILNYILFVTFFPHLIAGPILHNREMLPQYADAETYKFSSNNLAVGLTIFIFGLAKKCLLADPLAQIVSSGFSHTGSLTVFAAWDTILCYSIQLYFDFSGYSDMAIGLARMFNVRFPLNFNSPFKAKNVIEYWQRFHMTLTRFITLYIYNPISIAIIRRRVALGKDTSRAAQSSLSGLTLMIGIPTLITMALAGIWHGAGLQYLIFGVLHGIYITVNHAMRLFRKSRKQKIPDTAIQSIWKVLLTYLAVLTALVFFRSSSSGTAIDLIGAMYGIYAKLGSVPAVSHILWLCSLFAVLWALPNTQQIMIDYGPALGKVTPAEHFPKFRWANTVGWSGAIGAAACLAIMGMGGSSEFIYFQF